MRNIALIVIKEILNWRSIFQNALNNWGKFNSDTKKYYFSYYEDIYKKINIFAVSEYIKLFYTLNV